MQLSDDARISGSGTPVLMISNVQPTDQSVYDCVVTSNPCGPSVGAPITLNVTCSGQPFDCNANTLCDVAELMGLKDLTAPTPAADQFFGWRVAADAGRTLIGARFASRQGVVNSGRAFLFTLQGQLATYETELLAPFPIANAEFGTSVAIDGPWAVVAARAETVVGLPNAGSVYIFRLSGNTWQFFQQLTEPTPVAQAMYGHGLSMKGDRIVVGSFRGTGLAPATGAAYVYRFNGINWSLEAPLAASDGVPGDGFGIEVAIDDPYLVIAAPYDTDNNSASGSAYVYFRGFSGWQFQQKLRPRVQQPGVPIGEALAISGDLIALSSVLEDVNGLVDAGAAYVFRRTDTRWSQQRRLIAQTPTAGGRFGFGLAIEGNVAAVGEFGRSVAGLPSVGSAEIFYRRGNFWFRAATINSPKVDANSRFGYNIAIESGRMVASAYTGLVNGLNQAGWARVFTLNVLDCNANLKPDACEIAQGDVTDSNGNGIPDPCDQAVCRADFNDSGLVSVQDIFDFLTDWFAGNLTADFNDSGVVSVQDVFDFITVWFGGC